MKRVFNFGHWIMSGSVKPNDVKVRMPLRWIELSRTESKSLLISEMIIDWNYFDCSYEMLEREKVITWAESNVRSFLNINFYQHTFSDEEKRIIVKTQIEQESNKVFGTFGGRKTNDYVFLLSATDVEKSVPSDVVKGEILIIDELGKKLEINRFHMKWWLRTPGANDYQMCVVDKNGTVNYEGIKMDAEEIGIRPAIWVDREKMEQYQKLSSSNL